jgi:hypothetical protein
MLKRFHPAKTEIVKLMDSDDQVKVFDGLHQAQVTLMEPVDRSPMGGGLFGLALSSECHQCPAQPATLQEISKSGPREKG